MIRTVVSSSLRQKFKFCPTPIFPKHYSIFSSDQTLTSLLNSCTETAEITQIHGSMVKTGLDLIPFTLSKLLASSIIDIRYATSIFKYIQNPNLFMFNTMLRGYSNSQDPKQALELFNYIRARNILFDQFIFVSTLKSCTRLSATGYGCGVHSIVFRSGFDLFINLRNSLLHFYCVCGRIRDAHQLFDDFSERDLVSWNTLMGGYLNVSQPSVVLDLFRKLCGDGVKIGIATMLSALSAIGDLGDTLRGESLHGYCIKIGFCLDLNVVSAMIAMYGKTGYIDSGRRVFDGVAIKDVVLWNCLIDGYVKCGLLEESLALLRLLKLERVRPTSSTLVGLLSACATSGALAVGQSIHDYMEEQQVVLDAVLGTALVDMYSKCGLLKKAIDVFEWMESKDVKSWTAMILGYGMHGQAKNAIRVFHLMEEEGFRPNEVTFLAVLSACSHGGLVTEGMRCFKRMVQEHGLAPKVEHYGCIIDLLGRAGLLEEAHNLITSLPIEGDATAWRALLAACRVYGNVDLGECVKKTLEEIYDEHPADSIVLSSTYAIAGRMRDHTSTMETKERDIIKEAECRSIVMKEVGRSTIELDSKGWEQNRVLGSSNEDLTPLMPFGTCLTS